MLRLLMAVGSAWLFCATPAIAQDWREELISPTRTAVLLVRHKPHIELPTNSWFGGLPRMPPSLEWPVGGTEQRPMTFLAQIDLADLPDNRVRAALPAQGTLWFFASMDDVMGGDPGVRVLFDERGGRRWPIRAAPPNLPPMAEGYWGYDFLPDDDVRATVDVRMPLSFHTMTSRFDRQLRGAAAPTADDIAAALGRAPRSGPDLYDRDWKIEDDSWPSAGMYAELAARALGAELPPATALRDRPPWTSEGLAIRTILLQEAAQWGAHWGARRYEALRPTERREFRSWVQSFAARANVSREITGGWGMPSPRELNSAIERAMLFASYHLLEHGRQSINLVPEDLRRDDDWYGAGPPLHQMFGFGSSWQSAPAEHFWDVLLLQVSGTEDLFWLEGEGCTMHVWIAVRALEARQFDQVTSTLECD